MSTFKPNAYVHSKLAQYGRTLPSSMDDHEPTADERNGIVHRLTEEESVRFELSPGVVIEVLQGRDGIELRELGLGPLRHLAVLPWSGNQINVTTVRA